MMSFSKAKLKRFNDITATVESPSPCLERKDKDKENSKSSKKDDKEKTIPRSMDTESIKTSKSSYRLFRTPSLPRRLKFRHISDLTPKKFSSAVTPTSSASKDKEKEKNDKDKKKEQEAFKNIPASLVQLYNKVDANKIEAREARLESQNLRARIVEQNLMIEQLRLEKVQIVREKSNDIQELQRELANINKADELIQNIAEKSMDKIRQMDEEMKEVLKHHEHQLERLFDEKLEAEIKVEEIILENYNLKEAISVAKTDGQKMFRDITECREMIFCHDMELLSKIDEIRQLEQGIEDLIEEGKELKEQVNSIKVQAEEDMLHYIEENRKAVNEMENLRRERGNLVAELSKKQTLLSVLQEELSEKQAEVDSQRDEMRSNFDYEINLLTKNQEQQQAAAKEISDIKIKELESISLLDRSQSKKHQTEKFKDLEAEHAKELVRINEQAEEKIRIAEIQAEQKLKILESSIECTIQHHKSMWQAEMDKCQKIAETEIMQSEFEKRDLKSLLEETSDMVKDKNDKNTELQRHIQKETQSFIQMKQDFDFELKEARKEVARITTEKYNYQLTLNNTRSTVNILIERLKKSDTDVEILKAENELLTANKTELDMSNMKLIQDLEEYKNALSSLRNSSKALEQEMRDKEVVFEKIMTSEEDAIETVTQIGKLFNDRMEENISKYMEMYSDIKKKYESRETYIKDMKALLDEFATGIELARIELDTKDRKLFHLEQENKDIKLENMTFKFRCEQFEKYQPQCLISHTHSTPVELNNDDDDKYVSNILIENIINQLEKDDDLATPLSHHEDGDEYTMKTEHERAQDKIKELSKQVELLQEVIDFENGNTIESYKLREKLVAVENKLQIVEKFAKETSEKYTDLLESHNSLNKTKTVDASYQLKTKISKLQDINKKQENTILGLQEQMFGFDSPQKLNKSGMVFSSPKTPKTPKSLATMYPGKENSPLTTPVGMSPKLSAFKPRNA